MLNIIAGTIVPNTDYTVKTGGSFNEEDLVVCANSVGDAAFQAYYIVNGTPYGS